MPTAVIRGYSSRTHLIGWHPRISAVKRSNFGGNGAPRTGHDDVECVHVRQTKLRDQSWNS